MASKIYECISRIADRIIENKDYLTELDREIGDADHGINMARGYSEALEQLDKEDGDLSAVLKKTGMILLSNVGGASGPLYGTAYMKASKTVAGKEELSVEDGKAVFEAVIGGIKLRGKAERGEKPCWTRSSPPMRPTARQQMQAVLLQSAWMPCVQPRRKVRNLQRPSVRPRGVPAIWATAASDIRIPAPLPPF